MSEPLPELLLRLNAAAFRWTTSRRPADARILAEGAPALLKAYAALEARAEALVLAGVDLQRERDEARAEVERLRAELRTATGALLHIDNSLDSADVGDAVKASDDYHRQHGWTPGSSCAHCVAILREQQAGGDRG